MQTWAHCRFEAGEKSCSAISHKMTLGNVECQKFSHEALEKPAVSRCLTPLWQIINIEHMDSNNVCSWKHSPPCLTPCSSWGHECNCRKDLYPCYSGVWITKRWKFRKRFICGLVYSVINYSISFLHFPPKQLEWATVRLVTFSIVSFLLWPNLLI